VFGRSASDNLLRQVGRTIASVTKRASDVVARTGAGGFIVLGVSMDPAAAYAFADQIVGRLRALALHHPRSTSGRFVTVSAGVVTASPPRGISQDVLLEATRAALGRARAAGGNQAVRGEI
jgi:diguanylate cyclase (GGDEF)-like protein